MDFLRDVINEGKRRYDPTDSMPIDVRKRTIVLHALPLAFRVLTRGKAETASPKEILDYTEMFITSYCSINCKWCSASIPYYLNKYHIDAELLLKQERRYLEAIDGVQNFRVLGGEPLLHPDLARIIEPLVRSRKVKKVSIVTNGATLPKGDDLFALLTDPKVFLDVSNYGPVSSRLDDLRAMADEGKINLLVTDLYGSGWFVPNHDYSNKGLTSDEMLERYRSCPDFCHVLRDGKFFYCGEAFHICNIPDSPMEADVDYVDILDETKSTEDLRRAINDLVFKRNARMNACNHCVGSFIYKERLLVAGEQAPWGTEPPYELPLDIPVVSTKMI